MNKVSIIGRITKDPEITRTAKTTTDERRRIMRKNGQALSIEEEADEDGMEENT